MLKVRFVRFVGTGLLNTVVGYGFFSILVLVGVNGTVAVVVATLGGIAFNFFSYGGLVFKNTYLGNLKRFVAGYAAILVLNIALFNGFESLGFNRLVAGALCLPFVAVFAYVINSKFVFVKKAERT
jgi:putative flippase GtrA